MQRDYTHDYVVNTKNDEFLLLFEIGQYDEFKRKKNYFEFNTTLSFMIGESTQNESY